MTNFWLRRPRRLPMGVGIALLSCMCGCGGQDGDSPATNPESATHAATAPNSADGLKGYNVVLVVIDALRADHLGCYGYGRDTSPFLDQLAAKGVVFEQAYATSSFTGESVAALMSGVPPSCNPAGTGWYAMPDPNRPTMAAMMSTAGYGTGFFSDSPVFTNPAFEQGFQEFERLNLGWGNSGMGALVTDRALQFVDEHLDSPFLLHVHYFDPHAPYNPPEALYKRFASEMYPSPLDVIQDIRPNIPELVASGFGPGDPRFEDMVLRYDAEIAVSDQAVEALVQGLEARGLLDRTLLIITADHGEEFLEHGFVEHSWTVFPESIHVPLIVSASNALHAQRVDTPVSLVDIFPTVLELLEISYDRPDLRGLPLFLSSDARWTPRTFHQPVIAELMVPTRNLARSVIWHDVQFIAAPLWRNPATCAELSKKQGELRKALEDGSLEPPDPWRAPEFEALYDLENDPFAQNNLIENDPVRYRMMQRVLDAYRTLCGPQGRPQAVQPEWNEQYEEMMRNSGYF